MEDTGNIEAALQAQRRVYSGNTLYSEYFFVGINFCGFCGQLASVKN